MTAAATAIRARLPAVPAGRRTRRIVTAASAAQPTVAAATAPLERRGSATSSASRLKAPTAAAIAAAGTIAASAARSRRISGVRSATTARPTTSASIEAVREQQSERREDPDRVCIAKRLVQEESLELVVVPRTEEVAGERV